jgi:putative SOS response-associated peptidase YedK
MCNDYGLDSPASDIADLVFSQIKLPLRFPEGTPNFPPRADIRISETAPIIRTGDSGLELIQRPWAWPSRSGPVFNFRSEGRHFKPEDRVLIPAKRFYEFTAPEAGSKLKTKWQFTMPDAPLFAIGGS